MGHFIAIVWHQKLIFCMRHWESFQSCLWRLKQIFLAPCCHKFKLKMERRVNSQNIKRKASTYPWFAETYSSNIYSGNWVLILVHFALKTKMVEFTASGQFSVRGVIILLLILSCMANSTSVMAGQSNRNLTKHV